MTEQVAHSARIVLVTGGNQGIGYEIVAQLLAVPNLVVLVGARNADRGKEAVQKLNSQNAKFLQLDINSDQEITNAAQFVKDTYGGLDILINNAAIAWKGDAFNEEVVRATFQTNYFQTKKMCEVFGPLIRENGRLIIVSSRAGQLRILKDDNLRARYEDQTLTPEKIDVLANEFQQAVKDDTYAAKGYPKSAYGMSKATLNCYIRYLMRNSSSLFKPGVKIFACCPGWCQTAMSSFTGQRTAAKGAETPVWLALQPFDTQLKNDFYADKEVIPW